MYAYLHLPVQACADEILYRMKREYTLADFRKVVDGVLAAHPDMTVATDIIAGFPGETEEDFQVTMDVCQEYKFPCLYINQFFARPGTPAARMEKVDTKEVKGRTKRLSTLFQSYHPHAGKEGREYQVLCAELSNDKKFYVAHNKSYEQILVPKSADLLGKQFRVKIISTGKFHMMGEVVEGSLANAPALVTPLPYGSVSGGSVADPRRVEKLKAAEPVGASKDAATAVVTLAAPHVLAFGDLVLAPPATAAAAAAACWCVGSGGAGRGGAVVERERERTGPQRRRAQRILVVCGCAAIGCDVAAPRSPARVFGFGFLVLCVLSTPNAKRQTAGVEGGRRVEHHAVPVRRRLCAATR